MQTLMPISVLFAAWCDQRLVESRGCKTPMAMLNADFDAYLAARGLLRMPGLWCHRALIARVGLTRLHYDPAAGKAFLIGVRLQDESIAMPCMRSPGLQDSDDDDG